MAIRSLDVSWLGPFKNIILEFDPKANVLIGPNNCGKTTVLMALADACIYPFSMPERFFHKGKRPKVRITLCDANIHSEHVLPSTTSSADVRVMKNLGYTDFIPALRENTAFRPKSPMGKGTVERRMVTASRSDRNAVIHGDSAEVFEIDEDEAYLEQLGKGQMRFWRKSKSDWTKEEKNELSRRVTWLSRPARITDQEVVSKIVELDYRAYRKGESRYRKVISTVAGIASEIMSGFSVTFDCIEEDDRGLFPQFNTPDGKLPMDKLSQGTQSILQYLYHLVLGMAEYYSFPSDLTNRKAVFIIDEIDAHMHPEWQRRIIPTLTRNLPNCQLFVSTHSPLILSGLKEGQIHLLNRGKGKGIVDTTNDTEIEGWSVDEILQCFMGMRGTLDIRTEKVVAQLAALRDKTKLNELEKKELESLKKQVRSRLVPKRVEVKSIIIQ